MCIDTLQTSICTVIAIQIDVCRLELSLCPRGRPGRVRAPYPAVCVLQMLAVIVAVGVVVAEDADKGAKASPKEKRGVFGLGYPGLHDHYAHAPVHHVIKEVPVGVPHPVPVPVVKHVAVPVKVRAHLCHFRLRGASLPTVTVRFQNSHQNSQHTVITVENRPFVPRRGLSLSK